MSSLRLKRVKDGNDAVDPTMSRLLCDYSPRIRAFWRGELVGLDWVAGSGISDMG